MDHVLIRKLGHLSGDSSAPSLGFAVETRERPGPAHKNGAFENDAVWVQLHGGLMIATARIRICWIGEYSRVDDVRIRTRGSALFENGDYWAGRPKYGYAAVAQLKSESWIEPYWAGPRTYGYEWVTLEDDRKRSNWLDPREPPRGGEGLLRRFLESAGNFGTITQL